MALSWVGCACVRGTHEAPDALVSVLDAAGVDAAGVDAAGVDAAEADQPVDAGSAGDAASAPDASLLDATTPDTSAPSAPDAEAPTCPIVITDPVNQIRAEIAIRVQASTFLDATFSVYYGRNADGSPAGPCGRLWCPLGVDGGDLGLICADAIVGTPAWSADGTLALDPDFRGNPYFAKVLSGQGTAHVCSQIYPAACGQVAAP